MDMLAYASEAKPYAANMNRGDKCIGTMLVLESNISFRLGFKDMTKDMYATVEFTDHFGVAQKYDYAPEDIDWSLGVGAIFIDTLVLADARQEVTIKIYNADGSLFTECHDSIEAYLARSENVAGVEAAITRFADTAYAFLHKDDNK